MKDNMKKIEKVEKKKAKPRGIPYEAGNQFWKVRSKHGRDKIFTTPQILLEAAQEYFSWCDQNPLTEVQYMKGRYEIEKVELPKMRPYMTRGLCMFLGVNTLYFRDFEMLIEKKGENATEIDKDFSQVIAYIKEVIYTQKFTGAASGFFNPLIISRELGLREQTDNKHETNVTVQGIEYIIPTKPEDQVTPK